MEGSRNAAGAASAERAWLAGISAKRCVNDAIPGQNCAQFRANSVLLPLCPYLLEVNQVALSKMQNKATGTTFKCRAGSIQGLGCVACLQFWLRPQRLERALNEIKKYCSSMQRESDHAVVSS